jgi:N-acetylneuraminic acid mutarotase
VYDPATRQWGRAADLPLGLGHIGPATFVAGNSIVIAGGQTNAAGERSVTDVLRYDPAANHWTRLPSLPEPRKSSAAGFVGGELVVSTGNVNYSPYITAITYVSG